jgi:hypothetical protein
MTLSFWFEPKPNTGPDMRLCVMSWVSSQTAHFFGRGQTGSLSTLVRHENRTCPCPPVVHLIYHWGGSPCPLSNGQVAYLSIYNTCVVTFTGSVPICTDTVRVVGLHLICPLCSDSSETSPKLSPLHLVCSQTLGHRSSSLHFFALPRHPRIFPSKTWVHRSILTCGVGPSH